LFERWGAAGVWTPDAYVGLSLPAQKPRATERHALVENLA
jgi:hypothetical protein